MNTAFRLKFLKFLIGQKLRTVYATKTLLLLLLPPSSLLYAGVGAGGVGGSISAVG